MKTDNTRNLFFICLLELIPVTCLALLLAPYVSGGLPAILSGFSAAMEHPFRIQLCANSGKTILVFSAIYFLCIGITISNQRNYRRGVEYGSARCGA